MAPPASLRQDGGWRLGDGGIFLTSGRVGGEIVCPMFFLGGFFWVDFDKRGGRVSKISITRRCKV